MEEWEFVSDVVKDLIEGLFDFNFKCRFIAI